MKKILLTAVVFCGFGTLVFAQSKETKKTAVPALTASTELTQKAKDEKQIALKKEAAKKEATRSSTEEIIKPKAVPNKEN
jgi:hypothetical protein